MISAIIYTSNSGYTKDYAKLLGKELELPIYNLKKAPRSLRGKEVIYMGWIMAGGIMGYEQAAKKYDIKLVVQVGMAPPSEAAGARAAEKHGIQGIKVFTLQGGFDYERLRGVNLMLMKVKGASILAGIKKAKRKGTLTENQQVTLRMLTEGYSCVCEENLRDVVAWARQL